MRKIRFFSDKKLALGAEVKLSETAMNHAVRALRMVEGDKADLFNGDGHDYEATLIRVKKNEVIAKVIGSTMVENEPPLEITLLQGISSGDRMDFTIQKAVELGVKKIQPITTERSVVKLNKARTEKRVLHWQHVVYAACEQSGRAYVPTVCQPQTLNQWLADNPKQDTCRLLLNPVGATRFADLAEPTTAIQLLIGSEGGLTPSEIESANAHGFQSVLLGPRVLRTETAALAVISAIHALWGDF